MSSRFDSADPSERRLILVASKKGLCKLAAKAENSVLLGASGLSILIPALQASIVLWIDARAKQLMDEPTEEVLQTLSENLDLGTCPAIYSPAEALRLFKFGVGHTPTDGTFYVQHPAIGNAYVKPEEFSRAISKEKEAVFRQLASSLGAKKLVLASATIYTKRGFLGAAVPIHEAALEIGVRVEIDAQGSLVKTVYSEYGMPRRSPWVPTDLQPWIEMDPDLRTMVRDRTEGHLIKSKVTLEFKEEMGIGGKVAARLAERGLAASGFYEAICHSVWHFDVEYYPISS